MKVDAPFSCDSLSAAGVYVDEKAVAYCGFLSMLVYK